MKKLVCLFLLIICVLFFQCQENIQAPLFSVNDGVIHCKSGLPQQPLWFADSRLNFSFEDPGGITRLDYYYPSQRLNLSPLFLRPFHFFGIIYYLSDEKGNYLPEFQNSRIYPFGIEAEWEHESNVFTQKVMAVDETMVIQVETPDNLPKGYKFNINFNKLLCNRDVANWDDWVFNQEKNIFLGEFKTLDSNPQHFSASFGANFPIEYQYNKPGNKYYLSSPVLESGKKYTFFLNFGLNSVDLVNKNDKWIDDSEKKIVKQYERYQKVAALCPKLISPYKDIDNYFSLLPMFLESLKLNNVPGAIRANTNRYWIWGWDGMTNSSSTAYFGDVDHVKNILDFYETTGNPERGIYHAYSPDLKSGQIAPVPSQTIYISLLQLYYDQTKDLATLEKHYPFAKKIFKMACSDEVNDLGLSRGISLYPDDPVEETGNDLSAFNNSIFYCATRSMNRLASVIGDTETEELSESMAKKIEKNYLKIFYDKEKKYLISSVEATTFEKREAYITASLRWENDYYRDLIEPVSEECINFYDKNLVCKSGIRAVPFWDKYFDDANQLAYWWPVTDESFIRLSNQNNRGDLLDNWVQWLSYWYNHLTCPETVNCFFDTDDPVDPGSHVPNTWQPYFTWQAFGMRTWFQGIIHGLVGVDADAGGITIFPYNGKEMTLLGLHYLGKTFDFAMKGSGPYIKYIEIDGKKIRGTNKVPEEYYRDKEHIKITVWRTADKPTPVYITYGAGIILKNYSYDNGTINTQVQGAGLNYLKISSDRVPVVMVNNNPVNVNYNDDLKLAIVELKLKNNEPVSVNIQQ